MEFRIRVVEEELDSIHDIVVRENERIGDAVLRSGCDCLFCHKVRVDIEEDGDWKRIGDDL